MLPVEKKAIERHSPPEYHFSFSLLSGNKTKPAKQKAQHLISLLFPHLP